MPKIENVELGRGHGLGAVRAMPEYRDQLAGTATLSAADLHTLVDQAEVLLGGLYAHLPLKRALHADDPVQRLRLLRNAIGEIDEDTFHRTLLTTFVELRDLHTNYILPERYSGFAFLGILVEQCDDGDGARWLVTKVFDHLVGDANLVVGAEITHWNGMPMGTAVDRNADREAGSNPAARRARGVESMTFRPVRMSLPPDEDWVELTYRVGADTHETRIPWRVFDSAADLQPPPGAPVLPAGTGADARQLLALDLRTDVVQRAKRDLFAPGVPADVERARKAKGAPRASKAQAEAGVFPTTRPELKARSVDTEHGTVGHLRIFSFHMQDRDIQGFVDEVARLLTVLPQDGLVLDVRGNGGGYVIAAEYLLQYFTPRPVQPEPMQFAATRDTADLCAAVAGFGAWRPSLDEAVETGAQFSGALPLYPASVVNDRGQLYPGPVVLVTDALCYSATDIFSAGFQDHGIGPVLGVDANTGAGGANVLTQADLLEDWTGGPLAALPGGAQMRVALRRCLRVGARSGQPVEDLGVVPDALHALTRRDLLAGNPDLLDAAAVLLAARPRPRLDIERGAPAGGRVRLTVTTRGLDSVDVYVGGRPATTAAVADAAPTAVEIAAPGADVEVRVDGFAGTALAASRHA